MKSGVATRPIANMDEYRQQISNFINLSGLLMKPVYELARKNPKRLIYAEGEDERVLQAVQIVVNDKLAFPILIGRPAVVDMRIKKLGLRIRAGEHFELVNPENDPRYRDYWMEYHRIMKRNGITPEQAKSAMRLSGTLIGAMMIHLGQADCMLCGTFAQPLEHLPYVREVIGLRAGASVFAAMNILMLHNRTLFICDTHINLDPSAEQVAEMTLLAAEEVRRFGIVPKVALLSHSSFGSFNNESASKMKRARVLLEKLDPALEMEGEMHGDAAISEQLRLKVFPASKLKGEANLLIMPNLDAANISFNLLKMIAGEGVTIGPVLLGTEKSIHILTPTATVRRIVNMSALSVAGVDTH